MTIPEPGGITLRADAARFIGTSVATLKRREKDDPTFPIAIAVFSARSIGYRTSELLAWVASRPAAVPNQAATAAACAALRAKRASGRTAA